MKIINRLVKIILVICNNSKAKICRIPCYSFPDYLKKIKVGLSIITELNSIYPIFRKQCPKLHSVVLHKSKGVPAFVTNSITFSRYDIAFEKFD